MTVRPGRDEQDSLDEPARLAGFVRAVALDRDRAAFAALYRHYAPRLKSYVRGLGAGAGEAEELAQEAMILLWRKAAQFDPDKASVSTWVFTIIRNKRIDRLRKEGRPEIDAEDMRLLLDPAPGAEVTAERGDWRRQLARGLKLLPPEQREVLALAFFEDKSHGAVADALGLPLGTVKSRIRMALAKLRIALAAEEDGR